MKYCLVGQNNENKNYALSQKHHDIHRIYAGDAINNYKRS